MDSTIIDAVFKVFLSIMNTLHQTPSTPLHTNIQIVSEVMYFSLLLPTDVIKIVQNKYLVQIIATYY